MQTARQNQEEAMLIFSTTSSFLRMIAEQLVLKLIINSVCARLLCAGEDNGIFHIRGYFFVRKGHLQFQKQNQVYICRTGVLGSTICYALIWKLVYIGMLCLGDNCKLLSNIFHGV